jgi:phytanoyl-CoA hydroxylase
MQNDLFSSYVGERRAAQCDKYTSRYGGTWVDLPDADAIAKKLLETQAITAREHQLVRKFMTDGYVILEGAIPSATVDAFTAEVEALWKTGHPSLLVGIPPNDTKAVLDPKYASVTGIRMLDVYFHLESARKLLLHDSVTRFFQIVFNRAPLLFQSLSFPVGSEQGMHQDTAYVVVNSPMELSAAWIALEDIVEGSGELQLYAGSHRVPEQHFGGKRKHFSPAEDTHESHLAHLSRMNESAKAMGCELRRFHGKKGDVLIWHADLVHGGAPIINPKATRKSLVGHYCPADVEPNFFEYMPTHRATYASGNGLYCSAKYLR